MQNLLFLLKIYQKTNKIYQNMTNSDLKQSVLLPLSKLKTNNGQIEGLPKNPRVLKDEKFNKLKKSIEENPEMLGLRELLVYPMDDGTFVIIGGNMRYRAMLDLKFKEAPCKIIDAGTSVEQLRAYTIKDNNNYGEWDLDMLANEWDLDELNNWGLDLDFELEQEEEEEENEQKINEEAELLLNKAMQQYCGEFAEQLDIMYSSGYLASGLSEGLAKYKFIKAKYYNEKYPRYLSLVFTPEQFKTSANSTSYYEQLKESSEIGKAGIAGFRTTTDSHGSLVALFQSSYPIG